MVTMFFFFKEFIEVLDVEGAVLRPREAATIARVCLERLPDLRGGPYVVEMTVKTNASAPLKVPVSVFTGRLVPLWSDESSSAHRSIGRLAEGASKEVYVTLLNPNPVGVALDKWWTNSTSAQVTYLGAEVATPGGVKRRAHLANLTLAGAVRPDGRAVFHVRVRPEASCGRVGAVSVGVRTEHETLGLTLQYRTVTGALQPVPDPLSWKASFLDAHLTTEVTLTLTVNRWRCHWLR